MTKSKKLLLIGGLSLAAVTPIIAVVSCGGTTVIKKTATEILQEKASSARGTVVRQATSSTAQDATDVNAYVNALTTAQKAALITTTATSKKANEVVVADFTLVATLPGTTNGVTAEIGTPVVDTRFNTQVNVPIHFKKGTVNGIGTAVVVVEMPGFVARPAESKTGTIATAFGDNNNPRWITAVGYSDATTKSLGYKTISNNTNKQSDQTTFVNTQVSQGVKGFAFGAADTSAVANLLTAISAKDIPVVAYDRLPESVSSTFNFYTTFNNVFVGQLQGLALAAGVLGVNTSFESIAKMEEYVSGLTAAQITALGEIGVMLVAGSPTDSNAVQFYNGAKNVMDKLETALKAKSGSFEILSGKTFNGSDPAATEGWDAATASTNFAAKYNNLTQEQKNSLKGVLAPNDNIAISGIIPRLQTLNLDPTKIYITGQDAINNSVISVNDNAGQNMTVLKSDWNLTAINLSVLEWILANNAGKLTNETITGVQFASLELFVKTANPQIEFTIDRTTENFKVQNKQIITFLLEPKSVTSSTVSSLFNIEESK